MEINPFQLLLAGFASLKSHLHKFFRSRKKEKGEIKMGDGRKSINITTPLLLLLLCWMLKNSSCTTFNSILYLQMIFSRGKRITI